MQQTKTLISLFHWKNAIKANDLILLDLANNGRLMVYDELRNFFQPIRGIDNRWLLQVADSE